MNLETVAASSLSTSECNALRSLTLRRKGQMSDMLSDWRYDDEARVVRLTDDNGKILAWGINTPYDARKNKDIQIYVRKSERRKGYGTMVYNRLVNSAGGRANCIVHGHDYSSIKFFNKVHFVPQKIAPLKVPNWGNR